MKALYFHSVEKLEYGEIPDPKILQPEDAIVKVTYCGVCGSDLHVYHGKESGIEAGTVFGHEFVGEVVECGSSVKNVKVGQIVSTPFSTSCGDCYQCDADLPSRWHEGGSLRWVQDGAGLHGSHSEYVRVPHANGTLVELPESVPQEEGILLGDNLTTGFYCADMAGCAPGITVAVVGCGTVGVCGVVGAKHYGADRVFAVDGVPWRRGVAEKMGADKTFAPEEAVDLILQETDGRGVDAVMEIVGSKAAHNLAFHLVKPGGRIAAVGVHTEPEFGFSPADAYNKNIHYSVGRCPSRYYMDMVLPMLAERALPIGQLITHKMPLSDGQEAYEIFAARKEGYGKIVLQP